MAAAERPELVLATVSRGGRPDLVPAETLKHVKTPTLLIVGGLDHHVLDLNQNALALMQESASECQKKLQIVPGASHLFEEPSRLT